MKLSIILPTYNAVDYLENTIVSIMQATQSEFELIVLDDFSQRETREFVEGLESQEVPITKVLNVEHKWTNYNWNLGVTLAKGDYIAILNSDIILSPGWDLKLIEALDSCVIACPYEVKTNKEKTYLQDLHPLVRKVDPHMIKGSCFMFKASDKNHLFPIPPQLKHWCGDNWLADIANQIGGVKFVEGAYIKHFASASAKTLPQGEYKQRILLDLEAYEKISDRKMKLIKDTL
jgi:glycosyltransferase involved in cell wall biosynthesis